MLKLKMNERKNEQNKILNNMSSRKVMTNVSNLIRINLITDTTKNVDKGRSIKRTKTTKFTKLFYIPVSFMTALLL
jgi:hypothetical protein